MKPLGKAIKVALDANKPIQEAIDHLLTDYRSTPRPATGLTPGDMVFRGGYHSKLSRKYPTTDDQIEEAKARDKKRKYKANAQQNSSPWRKYPSIIQGDDVLVMRLNNRKKFQSLYEPTPYTVIDVKGARYTLLSCDTHHQRQPIFRHASQIKLYHQPVPVSLQHTKPPNVEIPHPNPTIEISYNRRKYQDQPNHLSRDPPSHQPNNSPPNEESDQPPEEENNLFSENSPPLNPDAIEPQITFCHPQQEAIDKEKRTEKRKKAKQK